VAAELGRYPSVEAIAAAMRQAGLAALATTHTAHRAPMTEVHLEKFRNKAFSSLRLIPEERFRAGLAFLEAEQAAGRAEIVEVYTYLWGRREA